jgi:hypothetical protein
MKKGQDGMRIFLGALVASVICFNAAHATDFSCPKPMAIPDSWDERSAPPNTSFDPGVDVYDPVLTGYSSAHIGTGLSIRPGSILSPISPGSYTPVDFPALNRGNPLSGADMYQHWLTSCSPFLLFSADTLLIEPGAGSDSTTIAFIHFIEQDPSAYWDGANVVTQFATSPRLVTLLAYDPNYPPESGRSSVVLVKFLRVFVETIGPSSAINVRIVDAAANYPVSTDPTTWGNLKRRYRN